MVLFDETRVLNPQADKTNVALSFSVPPGLTALQVEFTYDPPTPPEPVAVEAVKAALARMLGRWCKRIRMPICRCII